MDSIDCVDQKVADKLDRKIEEPDSKKSAGEWLAIRQAIDRPESGPNDVWNAPCSDSSATREFCDSVSGDRRATKRLPIELAVRYKVFGENRTITQAGSGRTLNMSSTGILFTTESVLPEGERVQLSVSWPVRLNDIVPLQLAILGRLVRVEGKQAAIAIERYEFRTISSDGFVDQRTPSSIYVSTSS